MLLFASLMEERRQLFYHVPFFLFYFLACLFSCVPFTVPSFRCDAFSVYLGVEVQELVFRVVAYHHLCLQSLDEFLPSCFISSTSALWTTTFFSSGLHLLFNSFLPCILEYCTMYLFSTASSFLRFSNGALTNSFMVDIRGWHLCFLHVLVYRKICVNHVFCKPVI